MIEEAEKAVHFYSNATGGSISSFNIITPSMSQHVRSIQSAFRIPGNESFPAHPPALAHISHTKGPLSCRRKRANPSHEILSPPPAFRPLS